MRQVIAESELDRLAADINEQLPPGSNLYLSGELGAGKTTFTRALLREMGSQTAATSPTFSLLNYHQTEDGRPIIHADLYRLESPEDVFSLNLLEALEDSATTVIVEWPERGFPVLPAPTMHLHLHHHTPETRVFSQL